MLSSVDVKKTLREGDIGETLDAIRTGDKEKAEPTFLLWVFFNHGKYSVRDKYIHSIYIYMYNMYKMYTISYLRIFKGLKTPEGFQDNALEKVSAPVDPVGNMLLLFFNVFWKTPFFSRVKKNHPSY